MRETKYLFVILVLLIMPRAYAEEEDRNQQISKDFISGPHLIYHCQEKYGACVDLNGYKLCEALRERDIKLRKASLACAPIKQFSSEKKCEEELTKQINQIWREKELCR